MEVNWKQMLDAAGECDSDSPDWDYVTACSTKSMGEWDLISEMGSVRSCASTSSTILSKVGSYRDVLLQVDVWEVKDTAEPCGPVPQKKVTFNADLPAATRSKSTSGNSNHKDDDRGLDAASLRDGVKQCRGGNSSLMFKGNQKQDTSFSSRWRACSKEKKRRRNRKERRSRKSAVQKESI